MPYPPATASDNLVLAVLSAEDREIIGRLLEPVDLPTGLVLYEPNEPLRYAYFAITGVISIVSEMEQGTVEIGTAGREGMLGIPILLHSPAASTKAFMQVPGHGWRIGAADLLAVTAERPAIARLLFRYIQALFDQVSQSVACNRLHTLEERCARWLLMVHDRVGDETLPLKQAFLADMLGVHRPAVTLAAGALQTAGLIRYSRGKVQVLDRVGLEQAACPCYRIVRESFDRLLERERP
jgi:CRP-like cAMP-binding protein